ncbi:cell division protein FtsL [Paenibacillus humicola]|uniref:cell division protein FtsL n=1 Tax=Paenibacillus humicola TaxID=3110540 RepID=UPI00237A58A9|nr:cell division protein FtsL [Paenibacillus humicola]
MAYVNGNLALQPKRKPGQKNAYKETKKTVVRRKSLPVQEKLLFLFTIVVFVVVLFVIISRSAQVYQTNLKVVQLNTKYQTLQGQIKDLQQQVQALNNPERIQDIATQEGMSADLDSSIKVKTDDGETATAMNR